MTKEDYGKMAYDPKKAVKHIVHDYAYLIASGADTQNPLKHPFNHYAERTFLVHCRALADFFSGGSDKPAGRDKRDLYACDFTPPEKQFKRMLPIWNEWHDRIDKHLMHLTKGRITNAIPWTGEHNRYILEEFRAVWAEFLRALKEELKPLFADEIEHQSKQFPDYQL